MTATQILTYGLAACAAVDIWLEVWLGEAAATRRAILEAGEGRISRFLSKLLACRFCLSLHAVWIGATILRYAPEVGGGIVAVLAVHKAARLLSFERSNEEGKPPRG